MSNKDNLLINVDSEWLSEGRLLRYVNTQKGLVQSDRF